MSPVGPGAVIIYDFLVIGAGIAGASIGHELARKSRVVMVEAEARPGVQSTGRSAALFAPTYGGRAIRALTRASRAFFDRPPEGFCDHALLRQRGCLYPARDDQRGSLARMAADIKASGGRVSLIDADAALAYVPLLRRDYVVEAAFDLDAMDIDVDALHHGFLREARAAGAQLWTNERAVAADWRGDYWLVQLSTREVGARIVVNAAGAWADDTAALFGARPVRLSPLRRTAVLVDPPPDCGMNAWPAVIDVDEMFYFKPEAGKLLLSPADETLTGPGDAHAEEVDIAIAVDRVQAALDIEVRRVTHSWAGLRTFAPDRAPVVGFDGLAPGFFWCAGQGGYGIQTAPAMSRTAAALALGGNTPDDVAAEGLDLGAISPARFMPPKSLK